MGFADVFLQTLSHQYRLIKTNFSEMFIKHTII